MCCAVCQSEQKTFQEVHFSNRSSNQNQSMGQEISEFGKVFLFLAVGVVFVVLGFVTSRLLRRCFWLSNFGLFQ